MPSQSTAKTAFPSREKMFLALIVTLAVAQLIAFWMLCNYQVRQAQARDATVQVRTAAAPQRRDPNALLATSENTAHLAPGHATPVNFTVH